MTDKEFLDQVEAYLATLSPEQTRQLVADSVAQINALTKRMVDEGFEGDALHGAVGNQLYADVEMAKARMERDNL